MKITEGLNIRQKEAVEHIMGPCLVLAGAGSGKTKVLTTRIANLIEHGIYSSHILAITFTNKAAKEMKNRLYNLIGDNSAFVGTFHSFGLRIIKENFKEFGLKSNFSIVDSEDVNTIIRKIMKELNISSKEVSIGYVKNRISFIKNEMLSTSDVNRLFISPIDKLVSEIYYRYDATLKNNNTVDFDDLLKLPVELFKNNDEILDKYQERYQYILVDEYQDTNEVQYQLIKLLSSKYRNIFVVGDSNQCLDGSSIIYTPEGAKKIVDITENDLVLTGVGRGKTDYQKIEHKFERDYEGKILTIKTKMGKQLTLTPDHICFYKSIQENKEEGINLHYLAGRITKTRNYCAQRLAFNTTDDNLRLTLQNAGFNVRDGKRKDFRIETERITALEGEEFVKKLAFFVPKAEINYDIFLDEGLKYSFINAGALKENMIIPIYEDGKLIEDTIIKVEENYVKQKVYDLSIPTTRNIIANDVCVHNCIYAFRGSNFKNILNFENDYPDALTIPLTQNYRSTTTILDAANNVIKNNKERKDLELFSDLGKGLKIKYFRAYDEKQEVTLIIEEIKKLLQEGNSYNDIAILYRTNGQARIIEEGINNARFPYRIVGSYYFYKRKEIKDLIAYLKLISNHDDEVSLRRIINEPKRGIGTKSLDDLSKIATSEGISLFNALNKPKEVEFKNLILELTKDSENASLTELIDLILDKSGMKKELEDNASLENEIRLENLMEFRSITENYQNEVGGVNLEDFLDEISIVSDISEHKDVSNAITLMTMHSAKGLEFKNVFLAGMEENIMPHSMSLQEENGLEEERRLCYVAITRAKERLYLSNAKRRMLYGKDQVNVPSRFISEIDSSLIDADEDIEEKSVINKKDMFIQHTLFTFLLFINGIYVYSVSHCMKSCLIYHFIMMCQKI